MAELIGVYAHQTTRDKQKGQAEALAKKLGSRGRFEIIQFPFKVPDDVGIVIAVGGDGLTRTLAEDVWERGFGVVLAMGGGSQDGLRKSLIHAQHTDNKRSVVPFEELADVKPDDIDPVPPALVNNKLFFLHTLFLGRGAITFSEYNESEYRHKEHMPRRMRSVRAAQRAGMHHAGLKSDEPILHTVLTAPDVWSGEFPGQRLHSGDLTVFTVDAMSKTRMRILELKIAAAMVAGGNMTEVFSARTLPEVEFNNFVGDQANVSGDLFPFEHSGRVIIRRATENPVHIAALC